MLVFNAKFIVIFGHTRLYHCFYYQHTNTALCIRKCCSFNNLTLLTNRDQMKLLKSLHNSTLTITCLTSPLSMYRYNELTATKVDIILLCQTSNAWWSRFCCWWMMVGGSCYAMPPNIVLGLVRLSLLLGLLFILRNFKKMLKSCIFS